ncbi:NUDIX hydrolase [Pseudomonas luteola]|uniref:NUDIX domain-containing protein n=1 Tax=Pseudomonas luteola TaxID=47886 RepID=A0ABS0FS01_PSELU|nr:NUDIX hydrolase [Pseudomonas zeshuii]MBF8643097.1 NUDIX domain-containing protein [Pseudomonas zeshuii]
MSKIIQERATIICKQDDKFLLVRKPKSKWSLPGGKIEKNETPDEAAIRELDEETGLKSKKFKYLAQVEISQTCHYVFETLVQAAEAPEPLNEIAACRWFSADELSKHKVRKSARKLIQQF